MVIKTSEPPIELTAPTPVELVQTFSKNQEESNGSESEYTMLERSFTAAGYTGGGNQACETEEM